MRMARSEPYSCLADAFEAAYFIHHVTRQNVRQGGFVEFAVCGGEGGQQQKAGGHLLDLQALLVTGRGRGTRPPSGGSARRPGPGPGGYPGRRWRYWWRCPGCSGIRSTAGCGAVEFLFDQADHAFVHGGCRGAGVYGVDLDLRRCHVRYWATGSCGMASAPASRMNSATTQANTGRSMKNCGMGQALTGRCAVRWAAFLGWGRPAPGRRP